jgi:hypothetical protein
MERFVVLVFFNGKMPFATIPWLIDITNITCLTCSFYHLLATLLSVFEEVIYR